MGAHLGGSIDVGVSRLEVIEGPSGRRQRKKAERAWIAAESMMSGGGDGLVTFQKGRVCFDDFERLKEMSGFDIDYLDHDGPLIPHMAR